MRITKSELKSLIKESIRQVMEEQASVSDIRSHKDFKFHKDLSGNHDNLTIASKHTFDELPIWFQMAKTKDATVKLDKDGSLVFAKGTWLDGEWHNGIWRKGTWENGTWKNGNWYNGVWENGTWENGNWHWGNWFDGTFKNGTFQGGKWHGGTWKKGYWEAETRAWLDRNKPHPNPYQQARKS